MLSSVYQLPISLCCLSANIVGGTMPNQFQFFSERMSNSLLSRENVVPFPFGQTLPEESDGPKWQQDWGLIGSNPGVRILSMDLLFLIFLFSSFSNFPHFLISSFSYFLIFLFSLFSFWINFALLKSLKQKKVLLTQLGLRPRNTDDRIDSQMFVLKVEFISFLKKILKHF